MSERDGYIPGVPCWVDSSHPDPGSVLDFYGGLFGWEFEDVMPDGGGYFIGRISGRDVGAIGSIPEGAPTGAVWNTYVWVDDADVAAERANDAGGSATDVMEVGDSGRMAVVTDPEGASVSLWQGKEHRGSAVVNEHGSVIFNGLATRDRSAAEAFYGALFGWRLLTLPSGPMWGLPGYGDHLEEGSPGLREQMAQMQAPEGFIDVVGAVTPIAADDTTTAAHWSVTFAVDDVAKAVATVIDLGGDVVSGPVDVPWSRSAVVADPQGATFLVSQFVPENRDL